MKDLNIPKLRFKGFKGEWKIESLKKNADIYDGTHQTPKYTDSGVKFVSVENINNLYSSEKFISKRDFENDFKIKPKKNDILMTRITAGIIGATAIVRDDNPLAYYVSLALIRKKTNININFLEQIINSLGFKHELYRRIIHVAFPKKINLNDIGQCLISFPKNEVEQQKIASFLDKVDEWIENLILQKDNLEKYKKGMMQKIFAQKFRFKSENGKEFEKWKNVSLKDVIYEVKKEREKDPQNIQLLTVKLHNNGIIASGKFPSVTEKGRPYYKRNLGELLIGRQNLHNGGIGFVDIHTDGLIASNAISSFLFNRDSCSNFIFYLISRESFYKKISNLIGGTGQKEISCSEIMKIKIRLPEFTEQQKIADFLTFIDKDIQSKQLQIYQAEKWKKGLMQRLFV